MKKSLLLALSLLLFSHQAVAALGRAPSGPEIDWKAAGDESVDLLVKYLRIDTTNPPGNEDRAARFFASRLEKERLEKEGIEKEGIEYDIFETAPGRSVFYARLKGSGHKRPLILLNHTDVVPADKDFWSVDPFGGDIRGGYVYGRGAIDMKSLGVAEFMVMLLLKRAGVPLDRDVIFLATPDEEAGGRLGAGWFVRERPELIKDAEFLLNEGSGNSVVGNRALFYGVGTTEKTPCWIRLTARGTPGHGSVPRKESAPSRMLRALGRLEAYETELKATPSVARYFRSVAHLQSNSELARAYSDISAAVRDPGLRRVIMSRPSDLALLSNTIQPTVVNIGGKTNVIAPIATAEIDCRLLPGQSPQEFVAEVRRVIADPTITVETFLAFGATESPLETDLYRAIAESVREQDSSAYFVPTVLHGFTDSHFFRDLGVVCYGFSPFLVSPEDSRGVHGNDERISAEAMRNGTRLLYRVVHRLCGAQGLPDAVGGKKK